ncbi:hypothetical protein AeRB84_016044 [Aphanomyces euteiches]|nr:hypothetical protein AeRB84_016044 [Aphanomyces euteiches]
MDVRDLNATLKQICRRLDALEKQIDTLPTKVSRELQGDALGLHNAMANLTKVINDAKPRTAQTSVPSPRTPVSPPHPRSGAMLSSSSIDVSSSSDEGFIFPLTTSRRMWALWFQGDLRNPNLGPFRFLESRFTEKRSKNRFEKAAVVIRAVVATALEKRLIASEVALAAMPRSDLLDIFDQAFAYFLQTKQDGTLVRRGFRGLRFKQVVEFQYLRVAKRMELGAKASSPRVKKKAPPKDPRRTVDVEAEASAPDVNMMDDATANSFLIRLASAAKEDEDSSPPSTPISANPANEQRSETMKDWVFPSVSCRVLWSRWFIGDSSGDFNVGPYRSLDRAVILDTKSRRKLQTARRVMKHLVEAAVASGIASDEDSLAKLPSHDLQAAFDVACGGLVGVDATGLATRAGFENRTLDDIAAMTFVTLDRRLNHKSAQRTSASAPSSPVRSPVADEEAIPLTPLAKKQDKANGEPSGDEGEGGKEWNFPSTTCRVLWGLWFFNDTGPNGSHTPFRNLTAKDVRGKASIEKFTMAKKIMKVLIDVAVDKKFVESEAALTSLARADSLRVFDKAFASFLGVSEEGRLTHRGFQDLSFQQITLAKYVSVYCQLNEASTESPLVSKAAPIRRSSTRTFKWSDGSERRAPEGWELPRTNCRTLWENWFLGDTTGSGVGPYRELSDMDLGQNPKSTKYLGAACLVVDKLLEIAETNEFVQAGVHDLAQLPEDDLVVVFERAFEVLMHNNPDGNIAGLDPGQIQPDYAEECQYTTVARLLSSEAKRSSVESSTKDADH